LESIADTVAGDSCIFLPSVTYENIFNEGVMTVPHSSSCFVHIHHPVIWFIRLNEEVVGFSMDNQELFDAQWYRIPRALFTEAAKVVRDRRLLRYGREEEICECDTGIRRCAARVRSAGGREELPDCTCVQMPGFEEVSYFCGKLGARHGGGCGCSIDVLEEGYGE